MTIVLPWIDGSPEADGHAHRAAEALRSGKLVAFATETVYGLGAVATDERAVRAIFAAKGRPSRNPLIVHLADSADVLQVAGALPDHFQQLADRFWPGPLTLVLPKHPELPDIVTGGGPTVAVRVPAHPCAQRLLQLVGLPIAAPSANRSGEISPTTADHVLRSLGGRIDFILDAGPTPVGIESTVLSLVDDPPTLLRPGHITRAQLEAVIGPIAHPAARGFAGILPSPGLSARHYSPTTRTILADGPALVAQLMIEGRKVGWLTLEKPTTSATKIELMPPDAAAYAKRLYAALHEFDAAGLDVIVVDLPPATDDWLAVRDRLRRAAL